MKQSKTIFTAFRCTFLFVIITFGLLSIIATGGMGGGDSGGSKTFYHYFQDVDGDGYGDPNKYERFASSSSQEYSPPQGYVIDANDCDDSNANVHPGATEVCGDGIDNNCNGSIDETCPPSCNDFDTDGYYVSGGCGTAIDCDDTDAAINPGEPEICDDSLDNDCDGLIDEGCSTEIKPRIPDTGQTTCYHESESLSTCPSPGEDYYGQDANYIINPLSYTKLDSEGQELINYVLNGAMVRDNVTGLIWEVDTDDGGIHDKDDLYTFSEASDVFIAQLNNDNFGGYSDWRLPTIRELISIVHYGEVEPAINTNYFPNTRPSRYWPSKGSGYYMDIAWIVSFWGGRVYETSEDYCRVRAVRGEQASSSFTDNRNGTITDKTNGLMWMKETSDSQMSLEDALAYCESLTIAGYSDWRLPTIKELQSLVDYGRKDPAIDTRFFPDTSSSGYWSSTTRHVYISNAWRVNFLSGSVSWDGKSDFFYVRAVRGGQ